MASGRTRPLGLADSLARPEESQVRPCKRAGAEQGPRFPGSKGREQLWEVVTLESARERFQMPG